MLQVIDRMANNLWPNLHIPRLLILDSRLSGMEKGQSRIPVSIEDLALNQQCASLSLISS